MSRAYGRLTERRIDEDAYEDSIELDYYAEMEVIGTHAKLRQIWIEVGRKRGFELVDA